MQNTQLKLNSNCQYYYTNNTGGSVQNTKLIHIGTIGVGGAVRFLVVGTIG